MKLQTLQKQKMGQLSCLERDRLPNPWNACHRTLNGTIARKRIPAPTRWLIQRKSLRASNPHSNRAPHHQSSRQKKGQREHAQNREKLQWKSHSTEETGLWLSQLRAVTS